VRCSAGETLFFLLLDVGNAGRAQHLYPDSTPPDSKSRMRHSAPPDLRGPWGRNSPRLPEFRSYCFESA
jgi:hypothetical protein